MIDRVTGVNMYPLKSAHAATVDGEVPSSLQVGRTGFEAYGVRDRDFVLYDEEARAFVSQRGWDANQKLRSKGDRVLASVQLDIQADQITVSSDIGELEIPTARYDGSNRVVGIFGNSLPMTEQNPRASLYFSELLGRDVRLLRSDHDRTPVLRSDYRRPDALNMKAGADGFPFLMTSEASLAAAHDRNNLPQGSVPLDRYRGNIKIAGEDLGEFGEDHMDSNQKFTINGIGFYAIKPCMRCPIPNIDQETGESAAVGGLKVLRGRVGSLQGSTDSGVFFGVNLLHAGTGAISVGDKIVVDSLQDESNIIFRS